MKQMLVTPPNRRAGGVEVSLAWFPWPVAHLCHTPESNTDERVHCPSAVLTQRQISSFKGGHGRSRSWTENSQTKRKHNMIEYNVKTKCCRGNFVKNVRKATFPNNIQGESSIFTCSYRLKDINGQGLVFCI